MSFFLLKNKKILRLNKKKQMFRKVVLCYNLNDFKRLNVIRQKSY